MSFPTAIVFDLDQTLFDRQHAMDRWLSGLAVSESDRQRLRTVDQNGLGNRDHWFELVLSTTGTSLDQVQFARSLATCIEMDSHLMQWLEYLKSKFELAILTNGGQASQWLKLQVLGLDSVFAPDRVFISSEIGYSKPDPRTFDFVANELGIPASECHYWGDQWETDVVAARRAGWHSHHVRRPADLWMQLSQWIGLVEAGVC